VGGEGEAEPWGIVVFFLYALRRVQCGRCGAFAWRRLGRSLAERHHISGTGIMSGRVPLSTTTWVLSQRHELEPPHRQRVVPGTG
jgi:hypothetical protein